MAGIMSSVPPLSGLDGKLLGTVQRNGLASGVKLNLMQMQACVFEHMRACLAGVYVGQESVMEGQWQ